MHSGAEPRDGAPSHGTHVRLAFGSVVTGAAEAPGAEPRDGAPSHGTRVRLDLLSTSHDHDRLVQDLIRIHSKTLDLVAKMGAEIEALKIKVANLEYEASMASDFISSLRAAFGTAPSHEPQQEEEEEEEDREEGYHEESEAWGVRPSGSAKRSRSG